MLNRTTGAHKYVLRSVLDKGHVILFLSIPNTETVRRDRVTHSTIIHGPILKCHIISKYDLSKEQSKALSKMLNCTKISATADVGVDVVVLLLLIFFNLLLKQHQATNLQMVTKKLLKLQIREKE